MSVAYFVELLSRTGEVEQRHRIAQLPIRIGRAYDNDVILDDEHAAAHHAQVEFDEEGLLQIRDLGSRNGMTYLGRTEPQVHINGNSVVRIGQTHLRVRLSNFEVEPEVVDTNNYHWEGLRPALAGVAMIELLTISSTWLSQTEQFNLLVYLQSGLSILLVAALWSGLWAAANRLFAKHPRFGRHIFIVGCGMLSLQIWESVSAVLAFMFSWEWLTRFGNHVEILILVFVLYFHLCTIKRRYPRQLLVLFLVFGAMGSGLSLMSKHKNTGNFGDELYMSEILSPGLRLSKDESLDSFTNKADKLKSIVDQERGKAVPDADDDE